MKFKRFLSLFFVVLLAVCIPCAFLAGCNGNSGDDGTDDNTSNNGSNSDKTGSGDEIFTEGMTLAQLRAATENIDNFTFERLDVIIDSEGNIHNQNNILMFDGSWDYQYGEKIVDGETSWISEFLRCTDNEYEYEYNYNNEKNMIKKTLEKSLLTNVEPYKFYLWEYFIEFILTDGEAGLEVDEEGFGDYQVTSSYVRLKGSVLEYGYTLVGKEGTWSEGESMQHDIKIYGVNATVIDTGKIQSELADAEWKDQVSYNGYHYVKDVDKDGNEYYYIVGSNNSEAEPEKTINTLPVKPRES